ncbi:MAG: hypothetical protein AAGD96_10580 [Chloroflexota bacterium]
MTTGLAASLNLASFALASIWLPTEQLVAFRLIMNTAITSGTLLCLGWDSSVVRLQPAERLGLLSSALGLLGCVSLFLFVIGTHLGVTSSFGPYALGLSLGCLIAYTILHFNVLRADGAYVSYFIGINFLDKMWRAGVVAIACFLGGGLLYFSLFLGIIAWVFLLALQKRVRPSFKLAKVKNFAKYPNRHRNVFFLASTAFMFWLARAVYFLTPRSEVDALIAIDLAMMLGAFLFVPLQSVLKVHEAERYRSGGSLFAHAKPKQLWQLFGLDVLILLGAFLVLVLYDHYVLHSAFDYNVGFTVLAGTVLISASPNLLQLAIHEGQKEIWKIAGLYLGITLCLYLASLWFEFSQAAAFFCAASLYLILSARIMRLLELSDLYRQRLIRSLILVTLVGIAFGVVKMSFGNG